jgi:hypothetical protein
MGDKGNTYLTTTAARSYDMFIFMGSCVSKIFIRLISILFPKTNYLGSLCDVHTIGHFIYLLSGACVYILGYTARNLNRLIENILGEDR